MIKNNKIEGIKSVDFKIKAVGNGVVNWNGMMPVRLFNGEDYKNHILPKLRGYNNEKTKEETGYRYKKMVNEIDFKETPMYVSSNCIRHHLFKDQSHDMHFVSKKGSDKDPKKLLLSVSGLLRGFVIPNSQCKRKSPLLIEDFIDQLGNGNFEQFGNSGEKDSNSIYSKTTFGETLYSAKGSISIEDIQFISLDKKFDRESLVIRNDKEGEELAQEMEKFIASLDYEKGKNVKVEYGEFIRIGTIYNESEKGLLLNETAISILVDLMIEMIKELSINQGKGWLSVSSIELDYNDSNKMMRIIQNPESVSEFKTKEYAIYYVKNNG